MDLIFEYLNSFTWGTVLTGIGLFAASIVLTVAAVSVVMVKIPKNYFSSHYQQDFLPGSPWLVRWGAVIAKNVLGFVLIGIGILLSLPLVPGPGFLTVLLGLIMLDIPGKRPLEARIIKLPKVLSAVNRLRERYGKPPLEMD